MSDPSQWHYTDRSGKQMGPTSTEELVQLLTSQSIPTTAMAWKNGMATWLPVNQIDELKMRLASPVAPPTIDPSTTNTPEISPTLAPTISPISTPQPVAPEKPLNPYEAPSIPTDEEFYAAMPSNHYGGVGRLAYFIISIVIGVVAQVTTSAMGGEQIPQDTSFLISGGSIIASLFLGCSRLKNIGMTRWWYLANIVPILNIFLAVWMSSRQQGWIETQRLDTAGKIIAWILWILIILGIIAIVGVLFFLFSAQ